MRVTGEQEECGVGKRPFQHARRFQTIHFRHGQIEDDYLWIKIQSFLNCLRAVFCFRADGIFTNFGENRTQGFANRRVVVGNKQRGQLISPGL